jgi:Uma2 family endonuclease
MAMSLVTAVPMGDERLYEVIDGRIVESEPMGAYEVWLATELSRVLGTYTQKVQVGRVVTEMLFDLTRWVGKKRRPDVAFVAYDRWPRSRGVPRTEAWDVVPNLAIEVVSPTNPADEIVDKVAEYFQAGVQLVWVVYPSRQQVYAYTTPTAVRIVSRDRPLDAAPVLPDFQLRLSELFDDAELRDDPEESPAGADHEA